MKNIFLPLFVFLTLSTHAQTTFAPPGAVWYNSMPYGVFHSYYTGDTTILGINCRIVVQDAIVTYVISGGYSPPVYNLPTIYVYNNADTVFMYNPIFNRFTPLYVFNVNAGDTIRLPILPLYNCWQSGITSTDSTFRVVVDSVKMILYDTATLKTVYSHPIGNPTTENVYNYGGPNYDTVEGVYAEKIGCISIGFLPAFLSSAGVILDGACISPDSFRCYNDSTTSIQLLPGLCDDPPTSITNLNKPPAIIISPNPATDIINIIYGATATSMTASIISMDGKEVLTQTGNNITTVINVAQLPSGIYILKLCIDNDTPVYKRISIVH